MLVEFAGFVFSLSGLSRLCLFCDCWIYLSTRLFRVVYCLLVVWILLGGAFVAWVWVVELVVRVTSNYCCMDDGFVV